MDILFHNWADAAPFAALALPVVLTLSIVRKARGVAEQNRAAIWFSCVRFLRWLVIGTLLAWWVGTDVARWRPAFDQFVGNSSWVAFPAAPLFTGIVFWTPPIVALVLCQVLLQPVYAGVRGVHWTRGELVRQMLFSIGATFLPLLIISSAVSAGFREQNLGGFLLAVFLAFACMIFFGRRLRKLLQLSPHALSSGDLRDRAFQIASQLRVRLQQVYLLPPAKSRLANAFARSGRSILLTHYLLSRLTRREVDAVIAHELAHLKHDHPRLLGFTLMGGVTLVAFVYITSSWGSPWKPLFDLLFIAVPLLAFYFVARRFEYVADATAVRVTGDPAAMITGLVKLHHLNLLPLQWDKWNEKLLTHPSTVRRAQAIGRVGGLSEERVKQLLDDPEQAGLFSDAAAQPPSHYELPSEESLKQKVFSTEYKQAAVLRTYLLTLIMVVALPAILLRGVDALHLAQSPAVAFLAVLLFCAALFLAFLNFAPFLSSRRLMEKMRLRAKSENIVPPDLLERGAATLVGLSPGPAPRIFDGNYSWDSGFLFFAGDQLCYSGEETQFALRRDQIVNLQLGPGIPGWFHSRSLYVIWRSEPSASCVVFHLRPLNVRSVLAMNRGVRRLKEQIDAWLTATDRSPYTAKLAEPLTAPAVRAVTGTPINEAAQGERLLALCVPVVLLAGTVAFYLGMPIEGFAPMLFEPDSAERFAGLSGWYAILSSLLLLMMLIVPLFRARRATLSIKETSAPVPPPQPSRAVE